jgi:hypothetical protein
MNRCYLCHTRGEALVEFFSRGSCNCCKVIFRLSSLFLLCSRRRGVLHLEGRPACLSRWNCGKVHALQPAPRFPPADRTIRHHPHILIRHLCQCLSLKLPRHYLLCLQMLRQSLPPEACRRSLPQEMLHPRLPPTTLHQGTLPRSLCQNASPKLLRQRFPPKPPRQSFSVLLLEIRWRLRPKTKRQCTSPLVTSLETSTDSTVLVIDAPQHSLAKERTSCTGTTLRITGNAKCANSTVSRPSTICSIVVASVVR